MTDEKDYLVPTYIAKKYKAKIFSLAFVWAVLLLIVIFYNYDFIEVLATLVAMLLGMTIKELEFAIKE